MPVHNSCRAMRLLYPKSGPMDISEEHDGIFDLLSVPPQTQKLQNFVRCQVMHVCLL